MTDQHNSPNPRPRLVGLDVLRFVAVTLVLHIHAIQGFGLYESGRKTGWLDRLLDLVPPGIHGVDIFFVLSGFLVSGLFFEELKRTGTVSPVRFLIRRGFKIYPAFWLLIVVTVVLGLFQTGRVSLKGLLAELFFFQNYVPGLWLHTWTLAVEEHFYFLLALVFFILQRSARRGGTLNLNVVPRVASAAILSCLVARILTWWYAAGVVTDGRWFISVTHVRIDALWFGVWLAHFWHNSPNESLKTRLLKLRYLWAAMGLFLLSPISEHVMEGEAFHIFGYMVLYVGAGCLVIASLSLDGNRCPRWLNWLAWLGRHSYSVYLWHALVLVWVQPFLGASTSATSAFLLKELLYVVCAWAFGIALARIIEFPVLRLRDRWFPALVGPR